MRRRRLGRGDRHDAVEEAISRARTTRQAVALALFDDEECGSLVLGRLNSYRPWAADAYKACQQGVHGAYRGALGALVHDTGRLADAPSYADGDVAQDVRDAWGGLSRACHHHAYELAPTSAELRSWWMIVNELPARLKG